MRFRFFYGIKPKLTPKDADSFSHGNYKCHQLLQNKKGQPVAISQHKDTGIWKVLPLLCDSFLRRGIFIRTKGNEAHFHVPQG